MDPNPIFLDTYFVESTEYDIDFLFFSKELCEIYQEYYFGKKWNEKCATNMYYWDDNAFSETSKSSPESLNRKKVIWAYK